VNVTSRGVSERRGEAHAGTMVTRRKLGGPASCAVGLECNRCGASFDLQTAAVRCPNCAATLQVAYDLDAARRSFRSAPLADRPLTMRRYAELLPPARTLTVGEDTGFTPLIPARRLGRKLGLRRLFIKDDTVNRPSLSYKDRGVGIAVQHALDTGHERIACVSTGNVGHALAAFAAAAGLRAYVFYPRDLEVAKAHVCRALGATTLRVDGEYDELNAACRELAARRGLPFVNITLRPFYAEGAKTLTLEVVEQLGWRAPAHILVPVAGATLINKVRKALDDLRGTGLIDSEATRIHGAQAAGSAPVANAVKAGSSTILPTEPRTYARSIAIGAPGDGDEAIATITGSGGWAETADDDEIAAAVELLAATEGIFAEPAGGATVAVLRKLIDQGRIAPDDVTVAAITGNGLKTIDHTANRDHAALRCDVDALDRELAPTLGAVAGARGGRP